MLENWPTTGIETTCESVQDRCKHCDKEEDEHANGQCLFQATTMELVPKLHREAQEDLDKLVMYCSEMEESIKNVEGDLLEAFQRIIDDQHADLNPPEKKECEKPGQLTLWTLLPSSQLELPVIGNTSGR